jgi:hypothetical protein
MTIKEDIIQPSIKFILNKINFINRYKSISDSHTVDDDKFRFSTENVIAIVQELGFNIRYSKSREFYLKEKYNDFTFGFGFTIRYNVIELGCSVKNEKINIWSEAPWGYFVKLMTEPNPITIFKPCFRNYEDLREILKEAFSIYEDFKREVIKEYREE